MCKFLEIPHYSGYYITTDGNVFTRKNTRIKKMRISTYPDGYTYVVITGDDGVRRHKKIHRLVAEAFIPNPEGKPEVNHKNGIRHDNNVSNLEWVTRVENVQHSWKQLNRVPPMLGRLGCLHKKAKLIQQIKNGRVVMEYYGTLEANRQTGINPSHIGECCKGQRATAGGYNWQYKQ